MHYILCIILCRTDSDSVIRWFESSYPSQNRAIFSDFLLKIALLFRFWEVFGK